MRFVLQLTTVAILVNVITAKTLYVTPNPAGICPGACHTLEYYMLKAYKYFTSNTLMVFLNGTHTLESSDPISLNNFTMIGSSNFTTGLQNLLESSSKINCTGNSSFYFKNASEIHIENLTFIGCGKRLVNTTNVRTAIAFDTAYNVTILRISARNSTGFGLHADHVFGTLTVRESIFQYNAGDEVYYGGNTRFRYSHCPENSSASVEIEASHFLNGNATYKHGFYMYPTATGITIISNCSFIYINITNVTVANNHADDGGNIAINITDFGNNHVRLSNSSVSGGVSHHGGGLRILSLVRENGEPCSPNMITTQTVFVTGTTFTGNHAEAGGGALYVSHYEIRHIQCSQIQLLFDNCTFINNTVPAKGSGAVMVIIRHKIPGFMTHVAPQFEISFQQCSFSNNYLIVDERNSFVGAIADIFAVELATFKDCNFTYNNNTALSAMNSNLVFEGNILFKGNNATNGGALKFCDTSVVYIRNNTTVKFIENHAFKAGGAIYAQQQCLETARPCFFQPDVPDFTYVVDLPSMMQIIFINNTAGYAGSTLYGGAVDYCYTYLQFKSYGRASYFYSSAIFDKVFNLDKQRGNTRISSDPYGVCLCNSSNLPDCDTFKNVTHKKYPGQEFNVTVVAVGQRYGVVPGIIEAILLKNKTKVGSNTATIPEKYSIQKAGYSCTTLSYAIESHAPQETINLVVQQSSTLIGHGSLYYEFHPPSITVLFLPCPWGFTLKDNPPSCECDPLLKQHKITCDINDQTVHRHKPAWVGYWRKTPDDVTSYRTIVLFSHCPIEYCNPYDVDVTINSIDNQCTANRTGIMCGACKNGFSLTLGSSHCLHCSNYYLSLMLLFALAGLVLVLLLTVCNLTVTEGTINGLIFYANIVQVNHAIFFPPLPDGTKTYSTVVMKVLIVFISWLNLDLGIEICFYDGMDAYAKAWLQFAFPIYIWVIAGMIIILSKKFVCVARVTGRNATKVLATMFLLSYAKFQRAIIAALLFTSPIGMNKKVWWYDGNLLYLSGRHIPLFLAALALLSLSLLCSLVLVTIQCLQRLNYRVISRIVGKFKPFIDAYTGAFKDKYRFWPGYLLLIRTILFVSFACTIGDPSINLLVNIIVCSQVLLLSVWSFLGVYKHWPSDVLDSSFFVNLITLSATTAYVISSGGNQEVATCISVGSALVTFVGILLYHAYRQTKSSRAWRKFSLWLQQKRMRQRPMNPVDAEPVGEPVNQIVPQDLVVSFEDRYREPLLTDN